MSDDIVKWLREVAIEMRVVGMARCDEAADRIEALEKGFRDILTVDDPMLVQMIAKACLTGAIDDEGKYCFVPSVALGEKEDE